MLRSIGLSIFDVSGLSVPSLGKGGHDPSRCNRQVVPKRRFLTALRCVTSQKIEKFTRRLSTENNSHSYNWLKRENIRKLIYRNRDSTSTNKCEYHNIRSLVKQIALPESILKAAIFLTQSLLWLLRDMMKCLRWEFVSNSPSSQARWPPTVVCPRLLVKHTHSCLPYLVARSRPETWGSAMPWWQEPTYHGFLTHKT
jgi:hypothetical protein